MAFPVTIISQESIRDHVRIGDIVPIVEQCLADFEKGEDILPDKLIFQVPGGIGACMAALQRSTGTLIMKNGQGREDNPGRGLPNILQQTMVYDAETGVLQAIMDGALITGLRTGASAALAARVLARPESRVLTMVGAGFQSRNALLAAADALTLEQVYVVEKMSEIRDRYVDEMSALLPVPVVAMAAEDAITQSDIIICCTNTKEPVVKQKWVRPGTHLSCMGADQPWKQETEIALIAAAAVWCDQIDQCCHLGEISQAIESGALDRAQIRGTLGQVITGQAPGREDTDQITLFDGTGLAVQDAAAARFVLDLARREGFGTVVDL